MLHEFLEKHRSDILALTRFKTLAISDSKPSSAELERGLPEFYDRLVVILRRQAESGEKVTPEHYAPTTTRHGKESLRLGYNVSQVVHGYGVICQAITETAERLKSDISAGEFSTLNLSLDVAIADAVQGFSTNLRAGDELDSSEKIGSLVHELRNALACALVAHSLIKQGIVGTGGSTNAVLERNLLRMRDLLDRSFSQIRLKNNPAAERHPMRLIVAFEEVVVTAGEEARRHGLTLSVEVDGDLMVDVDRNYLISALSNLVQNAIKFSGEGGTIWLRGLENKSAVVIEVEDQCGGLPSGKAEELFRPFTQKGGDRTGLGLGLSISRRAVALNDGTLAVRDVPGKGCVFFITLPKMKNAALLR